MDLVGLIATVQPVVVAVTPQGVDAQATHQDIPPLGATQHHMVRAAVGQVLGDAVVVGVNPDRQRLELVAYRVVTRGVGLVLQRQVRLQDMVRGREQIARQMALAHLAQIGVAHHQAGEGVGLELVEHVHALRAAKVVEAVAVLEVLHLRFEHKIKGGAQHAAKLLFLLGQTADPEVHLVQA